MHKSNGKAWGWIFPPLAEARSALARPRRQHLGMAR